MRRRSGNKIPARLNVAPANAASTDEPDTSESQVAAPRGVAAAHGDDDAPVWRGPSRSQKKRDAARIYELGVLLSKLRLPQLKRLPLGEDLLEAIVLVGQMKRTAQARQLRRVAKLLRDSELEPLVTALRDAGFD